MQYANILLPTHLVRCMNTLHSLCEEVLYFVCSIECTTNVCCLLFTTSFSFKSATRKWRIQQYCNMICYQRNHRRKYISSGNTITYQQDTGSKSEVDKSLTRAPYGTVFMTYGPSLPYHDPPVTPFLTKLSPQPLRLPNILLLSSFGGICYRIIFVVGLQQNSVLKRYL